MKRLAVLAGLAALAVPAAGVGSPAALPSKIGPGEGRLSLLTWEGYAENEWVRPFERRTGCNVHARYARSPDEMAMLMRRDGAGYDLVSPSGDTSLGLIEAHLVRPVNVGLVPDWKHFAEPLRSPSHNTIKGVHYGISLQWGLNTLLYNNQKVHSAPASWASIYEQTYRGRITVPDNPMQIADAALYLSKTRPALRITDPYELSKSQFAAAIALLERQRPLVKEYWALASDEVELFRHGAVWLGPSWQYQTDKLADEKVPVKVLIPREGATGWADTWMLSAKAKHPNCSYLWLRWVSSPPVQAEQAVSFGESPANTLACPLMDQLEQGSCARYHADASPSFYRRIRFWKTPLADCGNGMKGCVDYSGWVRAWRRLTR